MEKNTESRENFLERNPVYAKHMEQFEKQSEINRRARGNWTPAEKKLMTDYRAAKKKEENAVKKAIKNAENALFVAKQTGVSRGFSNIKGHTALHFAKPGYQGGRRTRNKRSHRNKRTRRNKRN